MRRFLAVFSILVCIIPLSGCVKDEMHTLQYYQYFDTFTEIKFFADDKDVDNITQAVEFVLKDYHQLCDNYHEYPGVVNIASINAASSRAIEIDDKLMDILRFACENYDLASSKVNIASGALLSLWHDARISGGYLPDEEALNEAMEHMDISNVILGENTVQLKDKSMSLDLGAVAKGFAADVVKDAMMEVGATAGSINMGGNVVCFGQPAKDRDYFIAGVQDPFGQNICAKVRVKDASLVTSGDYQRFYEIDGVKYHHIIDLETGYPGGEFSSVTVYHESSKIADLLSTAVFLSDMESGKKLARQFGAEVLWIDKDGNISHTDNFPIIQ